MINKVFLIGNLGKDPEVRHLEGGSTVAKFSLATNESYLDKNGEWQTQTEWHNIICWRDLAKRAEQQLAKGKLVYIEGKVTYRKWQGQDGNDRYATDIVARTYRLLERKERDAGFDQSFPAAKDEFQPGGVQQQPSVMATPTPAISTPTPTAIPATPTPVPMAPAHAPADAGGSTEDDLPF